MSKWLSHRLGDLFYSHAPGEWGGEPQGGDGDYFVLRSTNFTKDGYLDYSNVVVRYIPEAKRPRCTLRVGDILLEKSGGGPDQAVGRVAIFESGSNHRFGYANFIERLCVTDDFDPKFVMFRLLQSYRDGVTVRYEQQTTGIRNLKLRDFLDEKVSTPPLSQQRKIARILTTLDNLIEKTEALIAKYQAIKQGMMHDLFTRGVDEHGHLRPPYEEAPELYKQSELGWIPKEWAISPTFEVSIKIWIGLVTTMTKHYVTSGVKLIRNQNIKENDVNLDGIINLSDSFASLYDKRKLRLGDVVTVHTGDVGTSAVINDELDGCHGFATINTRVKNDLVSNTFLCHFYNSIRFKRQVAAVVTGDGRDNLNMKDFVKLHVPFPKDKTEQDIICSRIAVCEKTIATQYFHLAKLASLKTGLMQDLLTGKVRVKADEAEEVSHV